MRIGIVQSAPVFGEVEANTSSVLQQMASHSADLWVLPELFATGYQFVDEEEVRAYAEPVPGGQTTERLLEFSVKHGCHIVAGLPEADGDLIYNAAVFVHPSGGAATYRKIHLFYKEKLLFAPGNRPFSVANIGGARVGVMICFDHLFPESARSLALQGADIIAHPANLVLPDLAQKTMAVRALENGVFAGTANRIGTEARGTEALTYTGQSQIVDPHGTVLVQLPPDETQVAVLEIDVSQARDKAITGMNDKLADRRPAFYTS
jgi:5-aminopentanamidase